MSSNRASLLAGLRTGGPRSVSSSAFQNQGYSNGAVPQTAGADASGFAAQQRKELNRRSSSLTTDMGILDDFQGRIDSVHGPVTAPAQENVFAQLQQQQQAQFLLLQAQLQAQALQATLGGHSRQPQIYALTPEQQAMQLQIEMLKIQQNALYAQAQAHVQQTRSITPRTAGPAVTSFGTVAPRHRASSLAQVSETPMTAALDGRFPSAKPRAASGLNPNAATFQMGGQVEAAAAPYNTPTASANWRSNNVAALAPALANGASTNSKQHESATSWRRPSVVRQSSETSEVSTRSATPPTVYVSSPEETSKEHLARSRSNSPPHAFAAGIARAHGSRPQSLHFRLPASLQTRIREEEQVDDVQDYEIASPTHGSHDVGVAVPLPPTREEAARRLYEGLGIGRPQPGAAAGSQIPEVHRHMSQPVRQPRGPPGGADELGARNFASRIRSQGLGVLKEHHARRQSQNMSIAVEAY